MKLTQSGNTILAEGGLEPYTAVCYDPSLTITGMTVAGPPGNYIVHVYDARQSEKTIEIIL